MPKREVSKQERKKIQDRIEREFPGCRALQEIHRIRYIMELEWEQMTPEEIDNDIKQRAQRVRKEMKNLAKNKR
jgi:hypothetical protein